MCSLLESYILDIEQRLIAARKAEQDGDYDGAMGELEKAEALLHQAKVKTFRAHLYQSGVPSARR